MDTNLFTLIVVGIVVIGATIWNSRRSIDSSKPSTQDLLDKIETLVRENSDLKTLVIGLRAELQDLRTAEIVQLRREVVRLKTIISTNNVQPGANKPNVTKTTPSLMLVLGTDQDINDREENALRQAQFDYRVIKGADGGGATLQDFVDECNRRRDNDDMPDFIDLAMHGLDEPDTSGVAQGVLGFRDRRVAWREIAVQLTGVKLVLLGACESTRLADQLSGIVGNVISYTQGVGKTDALRFAKAFFTKIREGLSVEDAYNEGKRIVPTVRNMIDLQ